jgi:hypothetical protein
VLLVLLVALSVVLLPVVLAVAAGLVVAGGGAADAPWVGGGADVLLPCGHGNRLRPGRAGRRRRAQLDRGARLPGPAAGQAGRRLQRQRHRPRTPPRHQLDIEPYVEGGWHDDTQTSLNRYLTTVQGIVATYRRQLGRPASRSLQLGFAVPFWFDGEGDAPGAVAFNGATKPAARHLVDMLRDLSRAYLVIMSYRNFTGSDDGSIAHARNELWYAHKIKARCGLLVGQQYGLVSPEYITFNGHRRSTFRRAAAQITAAFQRYPQFRGLTVDDVDSYMAARP